MPYLVLGCGAIGGTVAAGLVRDGHDVLVADADPAVVAAVNSAGLRITGPAEEFTVPPADIRAVLAADLPDKIDGPVLLAVKSHHTAAAAALLAGRLRADPRAGYVLSLQNGLNAQVIADAVGPGRVVEAFVNFGADVIEPGVVLRGNRGTFKIGELDGTLTDRVRALTADIADAEPTTEVLGYLWAKEAYGAQLFATAVSDLPIYAVFDDPAYRDLLLAVAREVLARAPVQPVGFDGFDPADLEGSLARLADFNRASAKTHSGVYRDLAIRHRPTEAPAILGPLSGGPLVTPLIIAIAELIAAIERGDRTCTRSNLDLLAAYERLERLGRPLNAVVRALPAPERAWPGAGPLAAARGDQGHRLRGRGAHRLRQPGQRPGPGRAGRHPGRPAPGGRGRGLRHHPVPGVRGRLRPPGDRRHPQPPRPVPYLGRLVGRLRRPGRRGRLRPVDRLGHRRLDPHPGRLLRHRRPQAQLRAGPGGRRVPAVPQLRPRRHPDRHRARRRRPPGSP